MAWNKLIGLEREKSIFQKIILENKLASAYCFLGIEGIGKDGFALEIAKTVNCQHPIISNDTISPCEECSSCKMANSFKHPNIQYIFAQPAEDKSKASAKQELQETIKEEIKEKLGNPYHKINIPNARQINISLIRNITKHLMLADANGHRFVIISNGENMNVEASNAFLKTIEEPMERTTIIITSSHREKILPTILSRCQQFYFDPIKLEYIQQYIIKNYNKSEEDANLIAAISRGSITQACEYLDDNLNNLRNSIVDLLRISLKRKNYKEELLNNIADITKKKDRKLTILILELLLIWMRDAYSLIKTQTTDYVINKDLLNRITPFCNGYSKCDYLAAINEINDSINLLNRNIDPQLAYISLFIKLRKIFLQ